MLIAIIAVELLTMGIYFKVHNLRKLPFRPAHVTRVLRALQDSGVISKFDHQIYKFTDDFLALAKDEIFKRMPRSGILQFPVMTVFDVCGLGEWDDYDFESFIRTLRRRRLELAEWKAKGLKAWAHA